MQTAKIFVKLQNDECILKDIDYGKHAHKVKEDDLDSYKGIQSELIYVAKFDETTDIATTYTGQKIIEKGLRLNSLSKWQIKIWVSLGKFFEGTYFYILLDMWASKSFMSKSY